MKDYSCVCGDVVGLVRLNEKIRIKFVILQAASFRQLTNTFYEIFLVRGELEKWNKFRQCWYVLNQMLIGGGNFFQSLESDGAYFHVCESTLLESLVDLVNGINNRLKNCFGYPL